MGAGATDARARKCLDLSRELKKLGETPRGAFTAEHAVAQNSMAALGYELAGVFLDALAEIEETAADKLAVSKSLAQQVLDEYPADAYGSAWLEQAVGLIGRCQDEVDNGGA